MESAKKVISNKGHVRLFAVASVLWVAVTGPLLWKPLPYYDHDRFMASVGPIGTICGTPPAYVPPVEVLGMDPPNADDPQYQAYQAYRTCMGGIEAKGREEADFQQLRQFARWIGIVFGVPVVSPIVVILSLICADWIREGYGAARKPIPSDRLPD